MKPGLQCTVNMEAIQIPIHAKFSIAFITLCVLNFWLTSIYIVSAVSIKFVLILLYLLPGEEEGISEISLGEVRLKTDLLEHKIIYIGTDKLL